MDRETAIRLVDAARRPLWRSAGRFTVSESVLEDATAYLVEIGAEEWLIEGLFEFSLLDGSTFLVDKATGAVTQANYLTDPDRFDRMTPAK